MDRAKTTVFPILLIVVFGLAFVAGVRTLTKRGSEGGTIVPTVGETAQAFARAAEEDKLVMVKYGADWCPPCKAMKREAFNDASVAELLEGVIVVDIDVDNPGDDAEFVSMNKTGNSIPLVQVFRADGTKLGEFLGYDDVERFKSDVEAILAKA
jgi:thiol:disulfide interchange protein